MLPQGLDERADEHPYLADLATVLYPFVLCTLVGLVLYGGDAGRALSAAALFTMLFLAGFELLSRVLGGTAFRTLDPERR